MTNTKPYICTSTIPMVTKLGRVAGPQPQSHVTFQLKGHMTNEKSLYLHFHNIYGHQTWESGN